MGIHVGLLHVNVSYKRQKKFDDFMRNSNFGMGVLHVKVKY